MIRTVSILRIFLNMQLILLGKCDYKVVNYCDVPCGWPEERSHTVCEQDHMCGPGQSCGNLITIGLTEQQKQALLDMHNKLRNFVALGQEARGNPGPQPKASNMQILVWDDDLAFTAQCYANQCKTEHDVCRRRSQPDIKSNPGQNIAVRRAETINEQLLELMVQSWYDQVENMNVDLVNKYPDEEEEDDEYVPISQYSQLVWGLTKYLGCGCVQNGNTVILICNYHIGVRLYYDVYSIGEPCSQCQSTCDKTFHGLCSTKPSNSPIPDINPFAPEGYEGNHVMYNKQPTDNSNISNQQNGNSNSEDEGTEPISNEDCDIRGLIVIVNGAKVWRTSSEVTVVLVLLAYSAMN